MKEKPSNSSVYALLVGDYPQSRLLFHQVFRDAGWRLLEARSRKRALQHLERNPVQVVITDCEVPEWNWKDVLSELQRMPQPPQLIVTSRMADDYLWSEVLNFGGFDVLSQPFEPDEVERVIASARRHFDQPLAAARPSFTSTASIA